MEVQLTYFRGIIEDENINAVKSQLEQNKVGLSLYDRSGVPEMSLEEMVSQIYITLSPRIVEAIACGLLTNAIYESIKYTFFTLSRSIKGKTYKKHYQGGRNKEFAADFGIRFNSGNHNFDLKLPPEMDDQLKEICIKNAFEFIKKEGPEKKINALHVNNIAELINPKNYVLKYNEETGELDKIDLLDLIKKKIEEEKV